MLLDHEATRNGFGPGGIDQWIPEINGSQGKAGAAPLLSSLSVKIAQSGALIGRHAGLRPDGVWKNNRYVLFSFFHKILSCI
jgi:hypothetical protein